MLTFFVLVFLCAFVLNKIPTQRKTTNPKVLAFLEKCLLACWMIKNNFYILTGGPGGGKTSLLEFLAGKGYHYIPETARQIIKERLSKNLSPRPEPKIFSQEIFLRDWDNYISNSGNSSLLFFDRSFLDSSCMIFDSDINFYNQIRDDQLQHRYNNTVFITPPWKEIYTNDEERDQTFEDAIRVYERIDQWYKSHGYHLVILPKDTIEKRARFLLDHVERTI